MGPAGGDSRRGSRSSRSSAREESQQGRARVARDPDHGGQRLVLVVQPQARLGHGPDLGQPVPPAPAQRLQAHGRSARRRACSSRSSRTRADAGARRALGVDQPPARETTRCGAQAGYYLVGSGFGALHRPAGVVERVFYGNDDERLYFRIDTPRSPAELAGAEHRPLAVLLGPAGGGRSGEHRPAAAAQRRRRASGSSPRTSSGSSLARRAAHVTVASVVESQTRRDRRGRPGTCWTRSSSRCPFAELGKQRRATRSSSPSSSAATARTSSWSRPRARSACGCRVRRRRRGRARQAPEGAGRDAPSSRRSRSSGGVADVAASLSKELRRLGHDVRVVLPRYRQVDIGSTACVPVVTRPAGAAGHAAIECDDLRGPPRATCSCTSSTARRCTTATACTGSATTTRASIYFSRARARDAGRSRLPSRRHPRPRLVGRADPEPARPRLRGRAATPTSPPRSPSTTCRRRACFGFGALTLAGLEKWGLIRVGIPGPRQRRQRARARHPFRRRRQHGQRALRDGDPDAGVRRGSRRAAPRNAHKLHGIVNGIDYEQLRSASAIRTSRITTRPTRPRPRRCDRAELRTELGLERRRPSRCARSCRGSTT